MDQGEDLETPWAVDLGPAHGAPAGSRRVRLVNVPFLHSKPTWGDVIVASPGEDGRLMWDAGGASYAEIQSRIEEDGGRYAVIVDFMPHAETTAEVAWRALTRVFEPEGADLSDADGVCECALAPRASRPGRGYLAIKYGLTPAQVMERLRAASLPCEVTLVHPVDEPEE